MNLSQFDFNLPKGLIAQSPHPERHGARLLNGIDGGVDGWRHQFIRDLPSILPHGSLIIVNQSRVIPSFLQGTSGLARVSCNLLSDLGDGCWTAFVKGLKRVRIGEFIIFSHDFSCQLKSLADGVAILDFALPAGQIMEKLHQYGQMPLPPYIKARNDTDKERYQTVFAQKLGSVAAPTAGLHFSQMLCDQLRQNLCTILPITLHVGAGTFMPIRSQNIDEHQIHYEWGEINPETAGIINNAVRDGRFILCVGTTCCRLLESASTADGIIEPFQRTTNIFIKPGYRFKFVRHLLTNFHLPQSSLFILVCAAMGIAQAQAMVAEAIAHEYRFFSYGDASLIRVNQNL